jgi:hypothetical protein
VSTFGDWVTFYETAISTAMKTVQEKHSCTANVSIGGNSYNVRWGIYLDQYDNHLDVEVVASGEAVKGLAGYTVSNFHARRGDAMPEDLRAAILRGQARLEAWRAGGPFPESAEALFAMEG